MSQRVRKPEIDASLVHDIQALETRAHAVGMVITARALNNAKNTWGWEAAGNLHRASFAAKGERVGE